MTQIFPVTDQDKADFRAEYDTVVNTLLFLRDKQSFTEAEAAQALNYIAKVCLFIVRMIGRRWL